MYPSFTIAIPVFERLFGFEEALDSAIAVKGCTEILVADNNSSHEEFQKICDIKKDNRIRYVKHEKNYGIYGNQNRCAELATGTFLAILGSDDIIVSDIYKRFIEAYKTLPELDVFFGPFSIFFDSLEDAEIEQRYPTGPVSSRQFLEDAVDHGMRFPVLFVVRREMFVRFPFVTEPHSSNDLLWIYNHVSDLVFYADEKPLSYWRKHPGQDSCVFISMMYDVFPLLYTRIGDQLKMLGSKKASLAYRRAKRVIISLLINDRCKDGFWRKRLFSPEVSTNPFLVTFFEIAHEKWLIRRLLYSNKAWLAYYNIGRAYQRLKPMKGI